MPSSWMLSGTGQSMFLGRQSNSQYDVTGRVSPGNAYVPDEVAKQIVKESGLMKGDTVHKHTIVSFLESMGLSRTLATDVAMTLRNIYGVTPIFSEDKVGYNNSNLIEELSSVVSEGFPGPFYEIEPEPLMEADAVEMAIQDEFNESDDPEYDLILAHFASMPPEDLKEISELDEIFNENEMNVFESLLNEGTDSLIDIVVDQIFESRGYLHERDVSSGMGDKEVKQMLGRHDVPKQKVPKPGAGLTGAEKGRSERVKKALSNAASVAKDVGTKAAKTGAKVAAHGGAGAAKKGAELAAKGGKLAGKGAKAAAVGAGKGAKATIGGAARGAGYLGGEFKGGFQSGYERARAKAAAAGPSKPSGSDAPKRKGSGLLGKVIKGAGRVAKKAMGALKGVAKGAAAGAREGWKGSQDDSGKADHGPGHDTKSTTSSHGRAHRGTRRRKDVDMNIPGVEKESKDVLNDLSVVLSDRDVPSPKDIAENLSSGAVVDDAILMALSEMDWSEIIDVGNIINVDPMHTWEMVGALKESKSSFNKRWRKVSHSAVLPEGVTADSYATLASLTVEEDQVPRVIYWAAKMVSESGPKIREYVLESYPNLGKTVYSPAGDPTHGPVSAKAYMSPHEHETDKPDSSRVVKEPRMFRDPDSHRSMRERRKQEIGHAIKAMKDAADAAGVPPEGMFLNTWRDAHTEYVRQN